MGSPRRTTSNNEHQAPRASSVEQVVTEWLKRLSLFPTLAGYRRQWLSRDLLAGVTFGAITMPGQIATAHLAGMPPITGLYGFLAACLMGSLLAVNRHLAIGVDSTVAPILAGGLATLGVASESPQYVTLAIVTTFIVGFIVFAVGVAKMGWFGDALSKPVVIGFMGGIAVIIIINQLPGLFGLDIPHAPPVYEFADFVRHLPETNWPTLIIGVTSLVLLLIFSRVNPRFPGALIVLTVATLVTTFAGLTALGVQVLGPLEQGLPNLVMPDLGDGNIRLIFGTALAIAIICMAQTAATSRSSAAFGGFETDVSGDYRAVGAGNLLSSFFGAFTVDASPPSTAIISESRGRTQVASLVAAAMVIILLFASVIAENLPTATLSAVLIYIAIRIFRVDEMRATYEYSWRAFFLMLGTMIAVVTLGIVDGVAIAVLVSIIDRARRTARPELLLLGRTEDGQWLPAIDPRTKQVPGAAAFLLNGPLWFGNASWFRQEMLEAIPEDSDKPDLLILDATRMDDIDFTGAAALLEVSQICVLRDVTFAIASHVGRTGRDFERRGLIEAMGSDNFFDSVEEAIQALSPSV